jgi:hypothetical protein
MMYKPPEASNIGKDDRTQLIYAVSQNRAIVTHNRKDFIRIHKVTPNHYGIIVCTQNPNNQKLAEKIDEKIRNIDQIVLSIFVLLAHIHNMMN